MSTKLEAAFRYEYSRIRSESTLLQVVVPESVVVDDDNGKLHSSLIKTDLTQVIRWCRNNGIAPEKYLHERKLTLERGWGLSISLGKFFTVGGKDIEKLEDVTREDFQDRQQIAFLGQRGYRGSWVGQKVTWMADFKAEMTQFEKIPRLSDFQFGFNFKWLWEERALSRDEIDTYADYAEIWRATSGNSAWKELLDYVDKTVNISLEVAIDDFAFRELLKAANETSIGHFAFAKAKGMPWDRVQARSIVEASQAALCSALEGLSRGSRPFLSAVRGHGAQEPATNRRRG